MGEMADWAVDQAINQEVEEFNLKREICEMEQETIINLLEVNKENIPDNQYKSMVLDIIEKGKEKELSEKQRKVLNNCFYFMEK